MPPPASLTWINGALTLGDSGTLSGLGMLKDSWAGYNDQSNPQSHGWNNAGTKTNLLISAATGNTLFNAGTIYTNGPFGATAANGVLLNGDFENGSGSYWTVTSANGGNHNVNKHSAAQGSYSMSNGYQGIGVGPMSGTQFANGEFEWIGSSTAANSTRWVNFGMRLQLINASSGSVISSTGNVGLPVGTGGGSGFTYNGTGGYTSQTQTFNIPAVSSSVGLSTKVLMYIGDLNSTNYYAQFLSDAFTYSGGAIQIDVHLYIVLSALGYTTHIAVGLDNVNGGRADYAGVAVNHLLISQQLVSPSDNTQTKYFARVDIAYDMPTGGSAAWRFRSYTSNVNDFAFVVGSATTDQTYTGSSFEGSNKIQSIFIDNSANNQLTLNKYLKFQIDLNAGVAAPTYTTSTGTVTPVIKSVSIYYWHDNNYYHSQTIDIGQAASAYANFVSQATVNDGAIVYSFRSATSAANLSGTAWTVVTPPSNLAAITFREFNQYRVQLTPPSSGGNSKGYTGQSVTLGDWPYVDAIGLFWLNGSETTAPPPASVWYHNRYWMTAASASSSYNDLTYVYDTRIGAWTKHTNINAATFTMFKQVLLAGRAIRPTDTSVGRVVQLDYGVTDDNGPTATPEIITSTWKSKNFHTDESHPTCVRRVIISANGEVFGAGGTTFVLFYCEGFAGQTSYGLKAKPLIGGLLPKNITFDYGAHLSSKTVCAEIKVISPTQHVYVDQVTLETWKLNRRYN